MNTISQNELLQLAEARGEHLVSLYMPTYIGANSQQTPIRFKNLIGEAERRLTERGLRSPDARKLIESLSELLEDKNVWDVQGPSLAVFFGGGSTGTWRMPTECAEICTVAEYFHVLPLVEGLNRDAPYYVLAVSQNEVKLFRGSRGGIEQMEVAGLPKSRDDALRLDDPEPSRQQHAAARGTPGKQGLVFHGQGGAPDESKQEILAYFREIDRALSEVLPERGEPLIFAGVEYLFPIFQEANRYARLHPEPVTGNPELWSPAEIQQRAGRLMERMIEDRRAAAVEAFGNAIPRGQAADRTEEVLLAAHTGAVDTLFVDPSARVTGAFDVDRLRVSVDEEPRDDSEDLANLAAVLVLRASGTVETLESGQMPGSGPMAALLRYPLPSAEKMAPAGGRRG